MARPDEIHSSVRNFNPVHSARRSRAEIAAEIRAVDAAITELTSRQNDVSTAWRALGEVSVPVALRSLRRYRQRLARL